MTTGLTVYREDIISEAQEPRHYGLLENPDQFATFGNRSCGDRVTVSVVLETVQNVTYIRQIGWEGEGCVISRAFASVVSEYVVGKDASKVEAMTVADILPLLGLTTLSAGREKCAVVALSAIQAAIAAYIKK